MRTTLRRLAVSGLLAALAVVLLLPGAALAQEVRVTADGLDPDPLEVEVGEAVQLVNDTDEEIRLVDDGGRWDSGPLGPGEVFSISFEEPGEVTYASEDGELTGTIVVLPADEGEDTGDEPTDEPTEEPTEAPVEAEPTATPTATETAAPVEGEEPLASTGAPVVALAALALGGIAGGGLLLRRTS